MAKFEAQEGYEHGLKEKIAIVLVNLGTPDAPTPKALRRYLAEFLSDTRIVELPKILWSLILYGIILPLRPRRSAKLYQKIWLMGDVASGGQAGSPLKVYSQAIVNEIQSALTDQGISNVNCELAMRYGSPSIPDVLAKVRDQNARYCLILPMFPQYSATTTASVFDAVSRFYQRQRWMPQLSFINSYHDNALYIDALMQSIQQYWQQNPRGDKLLFSFHGIPKRNFDNGDPYSCFCHKTARLVSEKLKLSSEQWQVVFQSRFGAQPWLQPYCDKTLEALPAQGIKKVDVVCPGFAVDCLETLEEMNMENRKIFMEAGGEQYHYIPALNTNEEHIQCYVSLIQQYLQPWQQAIKQKESLDGISPATVE